MTDPRATAELQPPAQPLCWEQSPGELTACDRVAEHRGLHSWQAERDLRQRATALYTLGNVDESRAILDALDWLKGQGR